jgi:hypothetical protein
MPGIAWKRRRSTSTSWNKAAKPSLNGKLSGIGQYHSCPHAIHAGADWHLGCLLSTHSMYELIAMRVICAEPLCVDQRSMSITHKRETPPLWRGFCVHLLCSVLRARPDWPEVAWTPLLKRSRQPDQRVLATWRCRSKLSSPSAHSRQERTLRRSAPARSACFSASRPACQWACSSSN